MASNLSSIGFSFEGAEDFQKEMIRLAAEAIERIGCEAGDYSVWRSRTGAEIWFHLPFLGTEDTPRDIAGLTPFYEGLSTIDIEVIERVHRPGDNDFEGALTAQTSDPDGGNDGYPVTFDAVDFAVHGARDLPFHAQARITGFARQVRAFANEAAYAADKSGPLGEIGMAPRAFIPVGQFAETSDDDAPEAAASTALFTGRVGEYRRYVNEVTGQAFHWMLVESLAATFDVVADPEVVTGDIVEGGTVEVGCVLIGRLIDASPDDAAA